MPFVEDLGAFMRVQDFAEQVTIGGVSVAAIYDNQYISALDVSGTQPTLTFRTADVPAVVVGSPVVVRAINFTVAELQPDGTGITVALLQRS